MSAQHRKGRSRLTGGVLAAGFAGLVALLVVRPVVATAATTDVAVDRQDYNVNAKADPYNNDKTAMHVGATVGQETADSFLHLELEGLPPGAVPTGGTLTLKPDHVTQDNVNASSAILEACLLATELPASFDPANPPAEDCPGATSVGKLQSNGSWTFDLATLLAHWRNHNTGAKIKPIVNAPTDTYSVGFDVTLTGAKVDYTLPATATPDATQPPPAQTVPPITATVHSGGGISGYAAPAISTGGTVPASTATPTPSAPAASGAAGTAPPPAAPLTVTSVDALAQHWPLVLLAGLLVGAVLLARPLVAAQAAGKFSGGLLAQLRAHPRAFAVSGVAVAWCTTYSAYAAATGATTTHTVAPPPTAAAPQSAATPGGGTGGAGTPTSAATPAGGASGASGTGVPAAQAASTPGSVQNVNGVSLFVPANGGPPVAQLFSPQEDRIGITDTEIHLCGHAALTFGAAFNTNVNDFQVFWQNVNDHGGINGRKVTIDFKDDGYQPSNAVTAAQQCYDENPALLLGGIGFDQIPAVRVWAEQHHELYIHHDATIRGTNGQRYSFSSLPTVEALGEMFAQMVIKNHPGKKVGILYRQSDNWDPGRLAFDSYLKSHGHADMLGPEIPVQANQGSYASEISQLQAQGAQVAWAWENALAATEMIKQAKSQNYSPVWMVFPFNITLQGLSASDALNPAIEGVAAWPAYTNGDYSGPFAAYAADIHEFEQEYAKYDSSANLAGPGGDLLFLAWTEFKGMADLLQMCGRDCTRNKLAGIMLSGYHKTVSPNCDVDFSRGDPHHGGYLMETWSTAAFNGAAEWRPQRRCINQL